MLLMGVPACSPDGPVKLESLEAGGGSGKIVANRTDFLHDIVDVRLRGLELLPERRDLGLNLRHAGVEGPR